MYLGEFKNNYCTGKGILFLNGNSYLKGDFKEDSLSNLK